MTQDQSQISDDKLEDGIISSEQNSCEIIPEVELETKIINLEEEITKLKDQLLRAFAETENVRRRFLQQVEDRGKYAISNFAKDILQVADNLRRALESISAEDRKTNTIINKLAEGIELTEQTFINTLECYKIKKFESLGQNFDPHKHQVMVEVEEETKPAGTIVLEMQAGYTIHDRLLREAMVGVSKEKSKDLEIDI
jgi:molecular chaperone GrpE